MEPLWLPRKAALPLYSFTEEADIEPWEEQEPDEHGNAWAGRVLHCGSATYHGLMPGNVIENVGPNDVVCLALYKQTYAIPPQRLDNWDARLEVLMEVAPRAKAVLMGNQNAEVTWEPKFMVGEVDAEQCCRKVAAFIRETAELVRDCGGRPAFGVENFDMLMDAYRFQGEFILAALKEWDALQVAFMAHHLLSDMRALTWHDRVDKRVPRELWDPPEWQTFRDYTREGGFWGSCEYRPNVFAGLDFEVAECGFQAGVTGWWDGQSE